MPIAGDLDRPQVAHARKDRYRIIRRGSGEAHNRRTFAIKAFLLDTGISARYRPESVGIAGRNDRGKGLVVAHYSGDGWGGPLGSGKGYFGARLRRRIRKPPFHPSVAEGAGVMDRGIGAMEGDGGHRGGSRIGGHGEGAGVIEAVMRIVRASVFDIQAFARQRQGAFIHYGRGPRGTERGSIIPRRMEGKIEIPINDQGSAVGRIDCHLIESQCRVAGDGGDHELVGGYGRSIHLDRAVEAGRRSAFSLFIAPFVVGVREGDEIGVFGRQRQRIR